jgi:hypothetical protein
VNCPLPGGVETRPYRRAASGSETGRSKLRPYENRMKSSDRTGIPCRMQTTSYGNDTFYV